MSDLGVIEQALEQGKGVVRLAPNWVPRAHCRPGRRLRLHPDDYFALGLARGGIDERWFASTTCADNGPLTPEDEGQSYIVTADGKGRALMAFAVEALKGGFIGEALYDKYQRWPMFAKFFDNLGPLPHHIHHSEAHAQRVGLHGKPEMYFFPAQYNNLGGEFPFTFFGLNPDITKDQLKQALRDFSKGDNKLLTMSRAFKLDVDTGWDVPTGILHAPGSLCTYEPQFASDVYAMYQSVLYFDHAISEDNLWKTCPKEKIGDYDYLIEVLDWEKNLDPGFTTNRFMRPVEVRREGGLIEEWICYKCDVAGAKRITLLPGASAVFSDKVAFGALCVEGFGEINGMELSSPAMIRYGALTCDEYFITEAAARRGVSLVNLSQTQPLVLLCHFAEHPDRKAVESK